MVKSKRAAAAQQLSLIAPWWTVAQAAQSNVRQRVYEEIERVINRTVLHHIQEQLDG